MAELSLAALSLEDKASIGWLGDELLLRILLFLDVKSIARAACSYRAFHRQVTPTFWEDLEASRSPHLNQRSSIGETPKERIVRFGLASDFANSMMKQAHSHYDACTNVDISSNAPRPPAFGTAQNPSTWRTSCPQLFHISEDVYADPSLYEFFVSFKFCLFFTVN